MKDHTSDWLRVVLISGLGQTMNGKTYRCVLCYRVLTFDTNGMVDFVPSRAVINAAHRKRVKYEAKCANIGYGFLPFLFSSLGQLEKDAVTLLKRIRKFFVSQDIGARAAIHIFNRISFSIAKGVRNKREKDKIGTKPNQIKKKREAWRSLEKSKAVSVDRARKTEENAKRMVENAYTVKKLLKFKERKKGQGPFLQFLQSNK
nr:hypothetical protein [Tanacetum cinerariifolium]